MCLPVWEEEGEEGEEDHWEKRERGGGDREKRRGKCEFLFYFFSLEFFFSSREKKWKKVKTQENKNSPRGRKELTYAVDTCTYPASAVHRIARSTAWRVAT